MGKAVVVPLYKAEDSHSGHLHPSKLILRRIPEKRWGTLNIELLEQRQEESGLFSTPQHPITQYFERGLKILEVVSSISVTPRALPVELLWQ